MNLDCWWLVSKYLDDSTFVNLTKVNINIPTKKELLCRLDSYCNIETQYLLCYDSNHWHHWLHKENSDSDSNSDNDYKRGLDIHVSGPYRYKEKAIEDMIYDFFAIDFRENYNGLINKNHKEYITTKKNSIMKFFNKEGYYTFKEAGVTWWIEEVGQFPIFKNTLAEAVKNA